MADANFNDTAEKEYTFHGSNHVYSNSSGKYSLYSIFLSKNERVGFTAILTIIILFGLVGNILSLVVLVVRRVCDKNLKFQLICLGIADSATLVKGVSSLWLTVGFDVITRTNSELDCKMAKFFAILTVHLSSWFLVMITIQRFLAIVFPLSSIGVVTPRRSYVAIAVIILIFMAMDSPNLIFADLKNHGDYSVCSYDSAFSFGLFIFRIIHLIFVSLLPFTIILICNTWMIYSMKRSSVSSPSRSTVILLTALNVVFLLTTLPVSTFYVLGYIDYFNHFSQHDFYVIKLSVKVIALLNPALNFYMYTIFGKKFRTELKLMFRCQRKKNRENGRTPASETVALSLKEKTSYT